VKREGGHGPSALIRPGSARLPWPALRRAVLRGALLLAVTSPFLGGGGPNLFAQSPEPPRSYDLPRGDAAETLKRFVVLSETQVLYLVDGVRGVTTNAVQGEFHAREALGRMVARTPLAIAVDPSSGALMVHRQTSPAPPVGSIVGRIFNPVTGEYVRHARIFLAATGTATTSGVGGEYELAVANPGTNTLNVAYTGYHTASVTVHVPPGGRIVQDFNLVSFLASAPPAAEDPIRLSTLVVTTDREGAAKAIMDQRSSMNITHTVASDTFGDNPEGNIGEFMKHLPGVELDVFFGEVRTVRLGGLPSDYTAVTMDGMPLASVDAGTSAANNSRAFTMEMASLNSVESIEVSRTVSADVDANAPAGTINLRTKRAFDRAGRRVSWQANVTAHSEAFNFRRSLGPDEDRRSLKLRPGGIFEYSDIFLNKRLGVVLNISESNVYQEAVVATLAYSAATTPTDPRPLVPTTLNYAWAPRFNKRFSVTFAADYKVSLHLEAGLGIVYNWADLWTPQRTIVFNAGTRANVVGMDPLLSFTSAPNGSAQSNPSAVAKLGETTTLLPRITYRRGNLEVEAKGSYSDSTSWYDPLTRRHSIRDFNGPTVNNVRFEARRSAPLSADWKFVQIAGPDISSGANYTSPAFTANDGRFGRTVLMTGEVVGSLKSTIGSLPVTWKAGAKTRYQIQKFEDDTLAWRTDYVGVPSTGGWAGYSSPWPNSLGMVGGGILSSSGANLFTPDLRALGQAYQENRALFRQNWGSNASNFYESYVARRRRLYEQINAGFLLGTTNWNRLLARAGLRWEETRTEASEPDGRPPSEVRAAGFPVNSTGVATTPEGIHYQFLSRPRARRKGSYDHLFPSASLKYPITRSLDAQLGYSATIRRPAYASVAGAWLVNEADLSVTAPNPRLKPETATNLSARLGYYFEPVGQLSVTVSQIGVMNSIITNRVSAQAFGYRGDDDFARYDFITSENGAGAFRVGSMGLEYNQNFSFLGERTKRFAVHGSYTRLSASVPRAGLAPHLASGGLSFTLGQLILAADWNWTADANRNNSGTVYRRHQANLDLSGGWRLSRHYSFSVGARNILNAPWIDLQRFDTGPTALVRYETAGTSWTFALKANY
jgi:TonB-dependent receptor